jgi:hypothetical protein
MGVFSDLYVNNFQQSQPRLQENSEMHCSFAEDDDKIHYRKIDDGMNPLDAFGLTIVVPTLVGTNGEQILANSIRQKYVDSEQNMWIKIPHNTKPIIYKLSEKVDHAQIVAKSCLRTTKGVEFVTSRDRNCVLNKTLTAVVTLFASIGQSLLTVILMVLLWNPFAFEMIITMCCKMKPSFLSRLQKILANNKPQNADVWKATVLF